MTNSNCKGIGCVSGPWNFLQIEDDLYHFLYLLLVGISISYHRLFDYGGGVFGNGNIRRSRAQKDNPPSFSNPDRRLNIFAVKDLFDSHCVGLVFCNDILNFCIDGVESLRKALILPGLNGAVFNGYDSCASLFYYAETSDLRAGIDSKNFHEEIKLKAVS